MKRPLGVTIFGWGLAVVSAAAWYATVVSGVLGRYVMEEGGTWHWVDRARALGAGALAGSFCLVMSVGLLRLKSWARLVLLVCAGVSAVAQGAQLIIGWMRTNQFDVLIQLAIDAVIIWYFLRPSVKAQFVSKGR